MKYFIKKSESSDFEPAELDWTLEELNTALCLIVTPRKELVELGGVNFFAILFPDNSIWNISNGFWNFPDIGIQNFNYYNFLSNLQPKKS